MKKLLAILVLGLLWCNVGFAKVIHLKCIYTKEIRYTAYDGKLEKKTTDMNPVSKLVYSIDLDKEQMVGKNYEIWDNPENLKYDTHVFENKIIWLDSMIVEHKQHVFLDVFGQKAVSAYNYNEINRYNGDIKLSTYSQEFDTAKLFHERYFSRDVSSEIKKTEGLKYVHEINKIAKKNRKQKDNILVSTQLGSCDKMEKLDKKF